MPDLHPRALEALRDRCSQRMEEAGVELPAYAVAMMHLKLETEARRQDLPPNRFMSAVHFGRFDKLIDQAIAEHLGRKRRTS